MSVRPTEPLGPEHVSRYRSFVARRREPGGNQFNRSGEEFIKSQLHRPQRDRILRSKSLLRLPRDMTSICHSCPLAARKGSAVPMLEFLFVHPSYRNPCFIFTASHGKEKCIISVRLLIIRTLIHTATRSALWGFVDLMTCLHSWHTCISRKEVTPRFTVRSPCVRYSERQGPAQRHYSNNCKRNSRAWARVGLFVLV